MSRGKNKRRAVLEADEDMEEFIVKRLVQDPTKGIISEREMVKSCDIGNEYSTTAEVYCHYSSI